MFIVCLTEHTETRFNQNYKSIHSNYTQPVPRMANDNDEVPGPKTKPLRKTSAVPLRKETVRVTLKATPAGASGAPRPPAPAPPKPPSVATTPLDGPPATTVLEAETSNSSLPEVTSAVPLRQETMRVTLKADNSGAPMAPAPTIPLGGGGGAVPPAPATPAPTIPLGGGSTPPAPATPAPTIPLGGGLASPTVPIATQQMGSTTGQPLPTATVQLQQTQPMGSSMGNIAPMPSSHTSWEDEVNKGEKMTLILSIAALVIAIVAVGTQVAHSKHWIDEHKDGDMLEMFSTKTVTFDQKTSAGEYKTIK